MTNKELREAMAKFPDELPVYVNIRYGLEVVADVYTDHIDLGVTNFKEWPVLAIELIDRDLIKPIESAEKMQAKTARAIDEFRAAQKKNKKL